MAIKRVTLSATMYGQLLQNRFYVDVLDGQLDERAVAVDIRGNFMPHYRNLTVEDVRWFDIAVQSVGGPANLVHHEPVSIGGGQLTEAHLDPFATWVIQLQTGLAGRKFRGRMYAPTPRAGDFRLGFMTPQGEALANAVLGPLNNLYTTDSQANHPIRFVIHGETEAHDTHVEQFVMRTTKGVQRRRNINVGR